MTSLHDILCDTRNEDLAFRLKLLGVKPLTTKKDDQINAFTSTLAGKGLKKIWASLTSLEQNAIAEACYSFDLSHNESRFLAKYGSLPSFCNLPKSKQSYYNRWDSKYATRLNLLLFSSKYTQIHSVPVDLAERLKEFVPAPDESTMATLTEPKQEDGLYLRLTEHEALSEVMALLHLCEQGNLRISEKTAMPSAAGCKKILPAMNLIESMPSKDKTAKGT